MNNTVISTDSCADYFDWELKERGLHCITMAYVIDGTPFYKTFEDKEELYDFYEQLRAGANATTTQLNTFELKEYFEKLLKESEGDIVHFTLSSGLSGTYESARLAAEELNAGLSGRKIYVVDSLGATRVMAALIDYALELKAEGKCAEEIVALSGERRDRLQAWILVDNLQQLKRGGRISGANAAIGTMLNIKPILIINKKGKLWVVTKALGQHKALGTMASKAEKHGIDLKDQTVRIVHTGRTSLALAEAAAKKFTSKFKCKTVIEHVGPVIGVHLGADAIGIIFCGEERQDD